MSFTIMTNNIPARAGREKTRQHLRHTVVTSPKPGLPAPSLGGFQEGIHLVDDFKDLFPRLRIMNVFGAQPMWYDPRQWQLKEMDGELVYHKSKVGKKGAGPPVLTERYVQWLWLKYLGRPRANLLMINLHAAPSIGVPKQPDGDISRDDLHEMLMNAVADRVNLQKTPVAVIGDFNAEWRHSNMLPLHQAGLQLANRPGQPTHDQRQIDLILTRGGIPSDRRRGLELNDAGRFPKVLHDDHWGVWANFDFVVPS